MDYTIMELNKDILSAEELHFFYYDVMRNTEDNIQFIYDWNNDIQNYLTNKGIVIEIKDKDSLPLKVDKDSLYFTIGENDKNNKAAAFFRHLRNAFVHFRIVHEDKYLKIEDISKEKSMIGKIKYEDLKELCFLFFEQKDKFISENIR
ncbi:hypothetical protein [Phocaeicola coprocola]|uniref:hypothetical protein n=1 Tax=Phocaeicola coprocola TaxID=310298 RepID=UPI00266F59F3|nr:hypothetical protein [Phocaeicola coprocola]